MAEVQGTRIVGVKAELVATDADLLCMRCLRCTGVRLWIAFSLGDQANLQERLWCHHCGSGAHVINDRT